MESRRSFFKKTVAASSAVVVAPTIIPAKAFGANDRINAAVLGLALLNRMEETNSCV